MSWRVGNFLPVMLGLWSVLALSGTLAGEAAKGSLDLLASTPHCAPVDRAPEARRARHRASPFAMLLVALAHLAGERDASHACPATRSRPRPAFGYALAVPGC